MNRLLLSYQINTELKSVGKLRRSLQQVVLSTVNDKSIENKILLCLSESVTNIVEHGQPRASSVSIRFEQIDQNWKLSILDDGGFHQPLASLNEITVESDPFDESGRGLGLLKASCEEINYQKEQRQNCLIFNWPVNKKIARATILLVEDEASVRALFDSYLSEDYQVIQANDGQQALDILKETSVDLIISDINMPAMDGFSLRSQIAQQSDNELTPFIFLTANETSDILQRASSLGIDDYIIKPITKDKLIHHIERVLQRNQQIINKLTQRLDKKISESFIPKIPRHLDHWNIEFFSRNSGRGGGDFLLHNSDKQKTTLGLFDIMGHDETAKFFSYAYGGFISGMLRNQSTLKQENHQILKNISDMAYHDELLSKITLTGTLVELQENGKISICSAAHPHPLLVDEDSIQAIEVEGILPGVLPDAEFKAVSMSIKPGQRIALYTDGLFESADDNDSRIELEQKIKTALRDTIKLPVDRAIRIIMQNFDKIAGSPPRDDTTLVLLEPHYL